MCPCSFTDGQVDYSGMLIRGEPGTCAGRSAQKPVLSAEFYCEPKTALVYIRGEEVNK